MSEFGKYGVGGKMNPPPLPNPDATAVDLNTAGTGTCDFIPDKDILGISHKGGEGKSTAGN